MKEVNTSKKIMDQQIIEGDLFILLLVESGMTYRDVGDILNMSYQTVAVRYGRCAKRMDKQAAALLTSPVKGGKDE